MSGINPTNVNELFQLHGASREARAYAFLYAAFRRTEVGSNPVKDVIDCLIPFISPYIKRIAGQQVTSIGVQTFLKSEFGFDLPLYAIEQITSSLSSHGLVTYKTASRIYIALDTEKSFDVAKSEIDTDFEEIEFELNIYARRLGYDETPPSGNWGQALVNFLRNRSDKSVKKFILIKKVLIDPQTVEAATVAGFISELHRTDSVRFEKILKVFMGALIEDFISSISEVGAIKSGDTVVVFYDTALLLRMLGSSGRELRMATEELTRYLQDLGFTIQFLSGNEAEVSNIINTIISVKDSGHELEGETAVAISAGEVSTTDLRGLQHNFVGRLATYNIFPAMQAESSAQENARFQINETGLSEHIKKIARENQRRYGNQNSINDAGYIGTVMRLRKGARTRDLAECQYLFATSNRFLAIQARRYLVQERQLVPINVPPALSVGQLATIAWLLKDHTLPPDRVGRELLTNCFAAVRPDAEWFGYFKEGLEKVVGDTEAFLVDEGRALTLQAARRIAQDESFGNSAIMRQLNMAEVLSRAEKEEKRILAERDEEAKRRIREVESAKDEILAIELAKSELALAELQNKLSQQSDEFLKNRKNLDEIHVENVRLAEIAAKTAALEEVRKGENAVAEMRANRLVSIFKILLLLLFTFATSYAALAQLSFIANADFKIHAIFFASGIAVIRMIDWLKFGFWSDWKERAWLSVLRSLGHS